MAKGDLIILYHAETAGTFPDPLELGELGVDGFTPHLWTGVPTSVDPSGMIDLLSYGGGLNSGNTPPTTPNIGDLWFDTGTNQIRYWDGSAWVAVGDGIWAPLANPNFTGSFTINGVGIGALFAPLNNPSGGQHNYAPLDNPNFTGNLTINGVNVTGLFAPLVNPTSGQNNYLPIADPAYTGTLSGFVWARGARGFDPVNWQATATAVHASLIWQRDTGPGWPPEIEIAFAGNDPTNPLTVGDSFSVNPAMRLAQTGISTPGGSFSTIGSDNKYAVVAPWIIYTRDNVTGDSSALRPGGFTGPRMDVDGWGSAIYTDIGGGRGERAVAVGPDMALRRLTYTVPSLGPEVPPGSEQFPSVVINISDFGLDLMGHTRCKSELAGGGHILTIVETDNSILGWFDNNGLHLRAGQHIWVGTTQVA